MPIPASTLAETLAAAEALGEQRLVAGSPPPGQDWVAIGDLGDPDRAACEINRVLAGIAAGDRGVAGAFFALFLAYTVAGPLATALVTQRRGWPVDAAGTALRRHRGGWYDGLAVASPTAWVVAGDPAGDRDDVEALPDLDALCARVAGSLAAALRPAFAAVHDGVSYGEPGMWGQAADHLHAQALVAARRTGLDQHAAWRTAERLVDELARHTDRLRVRPRPLAIAPPGPPALPGPPGRDALVAVKGSCCLVYRTDPRPDPQRERYCGTCPLLTDATRIPRVRASLAALEPD